MVMRSCNHCHGQLGLIVHRMWMLRFCSKSCKKAYEHKLQEERRAKLRHLALFHLASRRGAPCDCRDRLYAVADASSRTLMTRLQLFDDTPLGHSHVYGYSMSSSG